MMILIIHGIAVSQKSASFYPAFSMMDAGHLRLGCNTMN